MILPDDVDEKVEFWVGESDTESDNESDRETVVGQGTRPWNTTNLVDSRTLRNKVWSERGSGSTNNTSGGATRRRKILGNGLLAVQSEIRGHPRNQHAFELKLETRRATRSEEGKGTPPILVRRNQMEKGSRWGTIGGLPDTGSEPVLSRSLESTYAQPTASSTTSLGGHERRWVMRPPGLGLDLWPDYVSPRLQASSTIQPRQAKGVPTASSRMVNTDIPQGVETTDEGAGSEREGSIDEELPRDRPKEKSKGSKERKGLVGAIWDWAWHWR